MDLSFINLDFSIHVDAGDNLIQRTCLLIIIDGTYFSNRESSIFCDRSLPPLQPVWPKAGHTVDIMLSSKTSLSDQITSQPVHTSVACLVARVGEERSKLDGFFQVRLSAALNSVYTLICFRFVSIIRWLAKCAIISPLMSLTPKRLLIFLVKSRL